MKLFRSLLAALIVLCSIFAPLSASAWPILTKNLSASEFLDWAEKTYPSIFGIPEQSSSSEAITFRFYAKSQHYLAVVDKRVFAMGPMTNGSPLDLGHIDAYKCQVAPMWCGPSASIPDLRGVQIQPHSDWKDSQSSRWRNIQQLIDLKPKAVRLMVDQYHPDTGVPLLPGQPLKDRVQASLELWGPLIQFLLDREIYVVLALNTYFTYPSNYDWPESGASLWESSATQQEVVDAWETLAQKYRGRQGLVFDLLNEPHGVTQREMANNHQVAIEQWNQLYPRIIEKIHSIDADRWLLVEPIWGQISYLEKLTIQDRPRVMYSIHYYHPHGFTFQGQSGWPAAGSVRYPSITADIPGISANTLWNAETIRADFARAKNFADQHNIHIVVGESGVYRDAPAADRLRYTQDILSNAKTTQFGLLWFTYDGWGVPTEFRKGWSWENSEIEPELRQFMQTGP